MSSRFRILILATAAATGACSPSPTIVCTTGEIQACFGIRMDFRSFGTDSTRITVDVQDLQGTVSTDNTAWSQLLYVRVARNREPSLGFPGPGPITPTWDSAVQTIGPSAPGSGWQNVGFNTPDFVSEWVAAGGVYGKDVGYISGRDSTYNQAVNTGAGLRTYLEPGKDPGWVRFSFVAMHTVKSEDVAVELSAWASLTPASTLQAPEQVGCRVTSFGVSSGPGFCASAPYDLD